MALKISDTEFRDQWTAAGGQAGVMARNTGISIRAIYERRNSLEQRHGWHLPSAGVGTGSHRGDAGARQYDYRPRITIDNFVGRVAVFSDAHWWPGLSRTLAYRALCEVIHDDKPSLIIGNGDLLDGASVSRFGASDFSTLPSLREELDEVQDCCSEIRSAYRKARTIRTIGNHCQRFDKYLANHATQFGGVAGFRLSDHLPAWQECVSVWINGHTVIKHRWHNGSGGGAAWNNVVKSGVSMVTGHTHSLLCRPYQEYTGGRRYGIEDGTLADPAGPQFAYGEDNPTQGCSGFVLLTFDRAGRLLYPEFCEVVDGVAYFRGRAVIDERRKVRAG